MKKIDKGFVIGIGLNLFDASAILLDNNKKVIAKVEKERTNINANETLNVILELFDELTTKNKAYKDKIYSVGLALGGIIDNKNGFVHWPQRHNSSCSYISVPLKNYLEKKFSFPITIENDANASLFAEYKTNFSKYKNIIYMFSGVGCGLLINGELYRGKDGGAGEVFISKKDSMTSHLGNFSFLAPWPFDLGIVNRIKELISKGEDTHLIKKIKPTGDLFLKDIIEDLHKKDKVLRIALKEAAFCLGVKISFLVNFLNPELVIIGGGLEQFGDYFLDECINVVKDFSFSEMGKNLKIVFSKLGKDATAQGAAFLALENL